MGSCSEPGRDHRRAYARQVKDGVSKNRVLYERRFRATGRSPNVGDACWLYRGFLIDQTDPGDRDVKPTWVGNNAGVDHYTMLQATRSVVLLSVGANINNKICIGASLGIQAVS